MKREIIGYDDSDLVPECMRPIDPDKLKAMFQELGMTVRTTVLPNGDSVSIIEPAPPRQPSNGPTHE